MSPASSSPSDTCETTSNNAPSHNSGNEKESARWLQKAADNGEDRALKILQLRERAKRGDVQAQGLLGLRYQQEEYQVLDILSDPKYAVAAKWYRKAAEQGDSFSQRSLGVLYHFGMGVPHRGDEALKWYRKAASQGDLRSQVNIGIIYLEGDGVPEDANEAIKWFQKAAEVGDADGQFQLASVYGRQHGLDKSDQAETNRYQTEAARWYRKAAEQGHVNAQNNLGVLYARGEGVPLDYAEAYRWYNLAAAQGSDAARNNRDRVSTLMTPEQIAEGQRLSRESRR